MNSVFSAFRPEIIFHAAAYKHVPLMKDNSEDAVTILRRDHIGKTPDELVVV
ncbi:MAG: polysaccharide biosynthesis protein [Chloroflexota bacterium]